VREEARAEEQLAPESESKSEAPLRFGVLGGVSGELWTNHQVGLIGPDAGVVTVLRGFVSLQLTGNLAFSSSDIQGVSLRTAGVNLGSFVRITRKPEIELGARAFIAQVSASANGSVGSSVVTSSTTSGTTYGGALEAGIVARSADSVKLRVGPTFTFRRPSDVRVQTGALTKTVFELPVFSVGACAELTWFL
jgi:hypothetical protein